jgi:hypothetical protein
LSKVVFVCYWRLCAFSKFRNSQQHECRECNLQRITKEKETQKSKHNWRQEEEAKLLTKKEAKKKLKKVEREGVLNIQLLVVKSLLHSSSSPKCAERKAYNEKIQIV